MANTFTFVINGNIPMIRIENPEAYRAEGFLRVDHYTISIRTNKYNLCLGSSYFNIRDFENIDQKTLIKHVRECIDNNRKTIYNFNFCYEDIPKDIIEAFIEASIEASHNRR